MMGFAKIFSFILLLFIGYTTLVNGSNPKHYVVYMGDHSHPNSESVIKANHELLASVFGSLSEAKAAALHHYSKSFRGFSAMLTPEQANQLAEHDSIVSVFENKLNKLHTTHSWDFLHLDSGNMGGNAAIACASDVIVGVIDTGIWPESESFADHGLGPVPQRFKGECVTGDQFTLANCNKKIIGARFYSKGYEAMNGPLEKVVNRKYYRSARDSDGHGTHTASTVAGSIVANASLFGIARGTAKGGAPCARLAIYKALWFGFYSDDDVLAAMDDAIHDGVDILSLSIGPAVPQPIYFKDAVSIGAFHAFQKGILVSASAGNSFFPGTATNVAPWILTVAASTIDREFRSDIYLGNSKILKGSSLNPIEMDNWYGLIYGGEAAAPRVPATIASFCRNNTLDPTLIKDKIVICNVENISDSSPLKAGVVEQGGGVGMILIDPNAMDTYQFVIPTTLIHQDAIEELQAYIKTEKNPIARINPTETFLGTTTAPKVAIFSSKGPNIVTPDIIKPDITGPGVNILAAWSPVATEDTVEQRSVNYNIISGTSMSCPHLSAVAAIIKSHHPSWSPATIMSAIMTTATIMDNAQRLIRTDPNDTQATPFDYGSGHVNPIASLNPGLVYDFGALDVLNFLCSTGATLAQLKNLTEVLTQCQKYPTPTSSYNFNYPSIGVSKLSGSLSVYRTITYYGKEPTVYVASVENPDGVDVAVTPPKLTFGKEGENATFRIDFKPFKNSNGNFVFGALTWNNGIQRVRSPIGLNVTYT